MCIKYSDCSKGYVYGSDGKQANNWNPDLNYGNEYVDVHFRIDTKGYEYPSFMLTEEDRTAFDSELRNIFTALGWKCKNEAYNGHCAEWYNGKSRLYLHPQDFSGEVLKNDIKAIAEALTTATTFKLRWIDLYSTVYDMTDEEYTEILATKNDEIKSAILDVCKTTRTTKFCYVEEVVRVLSHRFRLRRIGENDGRNYGIGQTGKHIAKIINSLVSEGYLVSAGDRELVRTINKAEQKKAKLFID